MLVQSDLGFNPHEAIVSDWLLTGGNAAIRTSVAKLAIIFILWPRAMGTRHCDCEPSRAGKINVSVLDISPRKFRPQLISDVQPLVALRQQPFNRRMRDSNKSPVWRHTRDNGVEGFADPLAHRRRCQPLRHFALNFSRRIFFQCAVSCYSGKLISQVASFTSVLRPGTFLTWAALANTSSNSPSDKICQTGFQ